MKRILLAVVAVSSLQACVLRIPGLTIGGGSAPSSSNSSSSPAAGQASILDSRATKAWREVLRTKDDELESLRERLNDQPKEGSTSADQHAGWALALLKKDTLAEVAAGCAAGTYKGEALTLQGREYLKAEQMCPLVVDREALLKKTVHAWGVAIIDDYFWQHSNRTAEILKSKRVSTGLLEEAQSVQGLKDYVASFAKKTFESIGETVPADALAKAEQLFKERQDVIMKLAAAGKINPRRRPTRARRRRFARCTRSAST